MIDLLDPRIILVSNTECGNTCGHCYYSNREDVSGDPQLLIDIIRTLRPRVAVGINEDNNLEDLLLIREAVANQCDLVITTTINNNVLTAIPLDILNHSTLVLSVVNDEEPDDYIMKYILGSTCTKIVSLVDTIAAHPLNYKAYSEFDLVYLLMEKGNPDNGWRMSSQLEHYIEMVTILMGIQGIGTRMDECVMHVCSSSEGNCTLGEWVEVTSTGEVRSCPYSINPDMTINNIEELQRYKPPTIPMCIS